MGYPGKLLLMSYGTENRSEGSYFNHASLYNNFYFISNQQFTKSIYLCTYHIYITPFPHSYIISKTINKFEFNTLWNCQAKEIIHVLSNRIKIPQKPNFGQSLHVVQLMIRYSKQESIGIIIA